jgi:valyl-tRNA synthetase
MRLSKIYEPKEYEDKIYALWEKSRAFEPQSRGSKDSYSIVIPPPNANGDLHLGHGLTLALEDIAVRYHRMLGEKTLFLPGADHAGFETQVVYEKKLAEAGKSRFDFSREELYEQIWDFVAQNKGNYESQFRRIGASLDWDRYVFTLDEKIVRRAYGTFKKMWDEGLIYRDERLVNYCTFHGTGFADIEVSYRETKGHLWQIRYPLSDGSGDIRVATTRPETMLGDVAVVVHPDDKRYKKLVGKSVRLPLTSREIPVIADWFVDQQFGTGAVKVTPAHDPNDFDIGQRHDLPKITVIGHGGKMAHEVPESYRGLAVKEARKQVVDDLKEQGYLASVEDYVHSVGHCYKCATVIEPLLKEQWFVNMKPLSEAAIKALQEGRIKFYPSSRKDQLIKYLSQLRDWNISRQIAWGIPIPAFVNAEDPQDWVFDERVDQESIEIDGRVYHRDPDVFDTWFSSSSWPYATLDYPNGEDFNDFYPLSVMETAHDILYPWVSRMIMLGLYVTGEVPFQSVYLHGLINDEHGQKMSKSRGNVIDPMGMIDKYGSDGFRMGIVAGNTAGSHRAFDESKLVASRNFCNKLWNIARFIEDALGSELEFAKAPKPVSSADHWILARLSQAGQKLSRQIENYRFSEGHETVYHLVWDEVADWYVEASKSKLNPSMLSYVLETILKLAHPYAPFVTETIWQTLHEEEVNLLITNGWPKKAAFDKDKADEFTQIKEIVSEIRQIKTMVNLTGGTLRYKDSKIIRENAGLIQKMAKLETVGEVGEGKGLQLTQTSEKCWIDISGDVAKKFVSKLSGREDELNQTLKTLKARLKSPNYTAKAPKNLVQDTRDNVREAETELETIAAQKKKFSKL